MNSTIPHRLVIRQAVYAELLNGINLAADKYEIGGILIGYRKRRTCFVEYITIDNGGFQKTAFTLDGKLHTERLQEIRSTTNKSLNLLGIWHSHICDTARFSNQDKISNGIFAALLDGTLSVLITRPPNTPDLAIKAFYITQDNTEYPQILAIR